jgi:hypothetical protein
MKIHRLFILTLLMISLSVFSYGQNTVDTAKINFIKTQYADINKNLKSYKRIEKTDTAETTEGNEVLLYYKGNEIKKIAAIYYGETGKALQEYYFYDKKLIFCYFADYRYDIPIYVNNGKVKIVSPEEKRCYLDDGKLFLVKQKPLVFKSARFPIDPNKEVQRLINLKITHE